jgi:hypothetical protein
MLAFPDHHSPSSINLWRNAPKKWCLSYLYNWKDSGPKMWRGTAVEKGFAAYLRNASFEKSLEVAFEAYGNEIARSGKAPLPVDEDRGLIEPMLRQAIIWHERNHLLELAATQVPVNTFLDERIKRPFVGYVDFSFLNGMDMDTKTTEACPAKPRPDHVAQVAVYWHARNKRPQSLLYLTDKRHNFLAPTEDELRIALQDMVAGALSLETALSVMPDRQTMLRSYPTNNSFYYDEATHAKLKELGE